MLIIDRIEGDWAVMEYGTLSFRLPLSLLPRQVREGDIIGFQTAILEEETRKRAEKMKRLSNELFE